MTTRFLPVLFCMLLGIPSVMASGPDDFNQANQQFSSGEYATAAKTYEKILEADGPSAAVLYNLGNSYQKLGDNGLAILAYERARLLTPRDPDLLVNLTLSRKAVTAFEEPRYDPRLDAALSFLSRNEWSWLVVVCALFLGVLSLFCHAVPSSRGWMRQFSISSACFAVAALLIGGTALYLRRGEGNLGIVLSDAATLRLSPFEKAESLGAPGPGRSVRMQEKNGDFHYVEVLGSGQRGWISSNEVAAIARE